ncbi:MAG: 1-deoxy-D-xylulose-5-phosphate synthase [Candidatus Brocadiia bacterium]
MSLLETITSPTEIKKIPFEELPKLAEEIRQRIMNVVNKNGGHLGSNLGVIELTIALYHVFNFPTDQIIWDVSHQCYAHKILSGRNKEFDTLRTQNGMSGFTNPKESAFDTFTVGHAGTAISTALGIACANKISRRDQKVIAVVGDGAMTCGMSWEALNQAGALKKDIIVIINDNTMSISRTIGAMANYLNKLRMTHLYENLKKDVYSALDRIPMVGQPMEKALTHIRSAAVGVLGGFIFEELGWSYYGPVNGHNIPLLIKNLKEIQRFKKPVILHVLTEKGCGSPDALEDPYRMHGIGPGKAQSKQPIECNTPPKPPSPNYTDIFADAAVELGKSNEKIVAITAAMPDGTGLVKFQQALPERYYDVGICEQHAIGLACGLAKGGLQPLVAIYSTFLQRAFDQLFHEVALQKTKAVFTLDRSGLVGSDGPTHHGVYDIAYLRMFPEFVLMAPKDGPELKTMLRFAATLNQPTFIRYPRTTAPDAEPKMSDTELKLGKSEILKEGKAGAIIAYGSMVYPAYRAALTLAGKGIELTVVNARFAKPLDEELIAELAGRMPFIITAEEHVLTGGFGSAVLEFVNQSANIISKPVIIRLGIPDRFIEHGSRDKLLDMLGLNEQGIIKAALEALD